MPRTFRCQRCDSDISSFLLPGEIASCSSCGATRVVPESAVVEPGTVRLPGRKPIGDAAGGSGLSRRAAVLIAIPVGFLLFIIALGSAGVGHGSYFGILLFFPIQFLLGFQMGDGGEVWVLIAVLAGMCLPWYPFLTYLFMTRTGNSRGFAILLLVIQAICGLVVAVLVY